MATKKKMLQAAAGQAGGAGPDITDVFSTYLYTGNGSTQTITNGIDLAGEGGLVWLKQRTAINNHMLFDTERGVSVALSSNNTGANNGPYTNFGVTSYNSSGFSLGGQYPSEINDNGHDYASWTFRKAPKFFDVVTWDGDGTNARQIPHSLGAVPHVMITRPYNVTAGGWSTAHYDGTTWRYGELNTTGTLGSPSPYVWGDRTSFIPPTDSNITVAGPVEGLTDGMNKVGYSYITYLFAHNDGDGEFGPDGDQDIIKCGSYTGNGSTDGPEIDLGFEPQWLMVKASTEAGYGWVLVDNMRGVPTGGFDARLEANTTAAEVDNANLFDFLSTGFKPTNSGGRVNSSGQSYIYIAIRRGPLAQPESGTEVFASDFARAAADGNKPEYRSGFPVDTRLTLYRPGGSSSYPAIGSRITGNEYLVTSSTAAGGAWTAQTFDYMNGFMNTAANVINTTLISHMFRRAPGFFDVVCTTGGTTPFTRSHNLGAAPEMIISKGRSTTFNWEVWHKDLSAGNGLKLNLTSAESISSVMGSVDPTDTTFDLGTTHSYVSYLFATLAGVSKVGSYTGNGSSQTIDCGFTSGARFILIKRTDSTGDWYVWDTARGIVAGNDPHLSLNTTAAEVTSDDSIDPDNSGFIVNQVAATNINVSSASYIFYAIA